MKNRKEIIGMIIAATIISFIFVFGLTAAYLGLYEWVRGQGVGFWQTVILYSSIVVAAGVSASWNRFWGDQGSD